MSGLKDLQNSFLQKIMEGGEEPLAYIKPSSITSVDRFGIYRHAILTNLRNALRITFPGIWKIIGQECADQAVNIFCKDLNNLPFSGCLDDWGEKFPEFLGTIEQLKGLRYLKDYAQLEWLQQLSYMAEEKNSISFGDLQQISSDVMETLTLRLHPSVFLFKSLFQIDRIFELIHNPDASSLTLQENAVYAIICRPDDEVYTYWVPEHYFNFINALQDGKNLSKATEIALEENLWPELTDIIEFIINKKLITGIT